MVDQDGLLPTDNSVMIYPVTVFYCICYDYQHYGGWISDLLFVCDIHGGGEDRGWCNGGDDDNS